MCIFHKWHEDNPASRTCLKCGLQQHIMGSYDGSIPDRWVDYSIVELVSYKKWWKLN